MTPSERIATCSIGVGVAVFALKTAAWAVTGSAALFSDAAETLVNVAAALMALAALHFAARPADANHPYGHDKAEFFAAMVEGALIIIAAFVILQHSWASWRDPGPLLAPVPGVALNAGGTLLNLGWSVALRRAGRRLRSPVLAADARHLAADVVTSAGIVLGVGVAIASGQPWVDPAVAAVAAIYVLVSGLLVIGRSVGGLMDEAPPTETLERIRAVVGRSADGAIEAHDLRTRHAGRLTYLEFHLVVPADMTVSAAHEICDRIEGALKAEMADVVTTIHLEPPHKAKHSGVVVV